MALAVVAPASSAAPTPRTSLAEVEQEVMCPVCGTPLMVSQSPLADRERAFISVRIARGETKEQIKRDMVAEFGPAVLAAPPRRGFDLTAYLVPVAGVLAALIALTLKVTRWRRPHPRAEDQPAVPALAPELSRRLDEDLARYDL